MSDFVTRFAPSPSGRLHLGHAFSALTAYDAAQAAGGVMRLRIEDIDVARCRREYEDALLDDLRWLGLTWPEPVRRQSDHFDDYRAALDRLIELGVVYRCFKTRKEILEEIARAPHFAGEGPDGAVYRGPETPMSAQEEAERVDAGEPYAWRLSLARCRDLLGERFGRLAFFEEGEGPDGESGEVRARPDLLGDAVVGRKDVGTSYHVAVVHDDALEAITHVIRGRDLFLSTHLHRLLQELLGLPTPVYRHHRLIADEAGKRLAKRDAAREIAVLRAEGATPKDVRRLVGL
jgi:glutamyl-Q tRNA(Asp) synthetase